MRALAESTRLELTTGYSGQPPELKIEDIWQDHQAISDVLNINSTIVC